ncbi:MAG TPA: hypothetical protein DCQ58_03055 [Saprospirales bacterium]|nr:hypothetical protein [Saprospirales bacterium]
MQRYFFHHKGYHSVESGKFIKLKVHIVKSTTFNFPLSTEVGGHSGLVPIGQSEHQGLYLHPVFVSWI